MSHGAYCLLARVVPPRSPSALNLHEGFAADIQLVNILVVLDIGPILGVDERIYGVLTVGDGDGALARGRAAIPATRVIEGLTKDSGGYDVEVGDVDIQRNPISCTKALCV